MRSTRSFSSLLFLAALLWTVLLPTRAQTQATGHLVGWGNLPVGFPAGLNDVIAVAGGTVHGIALRADGTIVAWGDNLNGQTDVPAGLTAVVAITAGANHTLALKADGTVVGWGGNDFGS